MYNADSAGRTSTHAAGGRPIRTRYGMRRSGRNRPTSPIHPERPRQSRIDRTIKHRDGERTRPSAAGGVPEGLPQIITQISQDIDDAVFLFVGFIIRGSGAIAQRLQTRGRLSIGGCILIGG